jgi:hypothetical protein
MALILLVSKRFATIWTWMRTNAMRHENSVFHQLTKHLPWSVFDGAVSAHGADRRVRRLRTRDQFLALLYGQFSGASSLREIEDGLRSHEVLLYHAGLRRVSRSTLADANHKRSFEVYADVFAEMARLATPGLRRKIRDTVRLLDATKVRLSSLSEGWARFSEDHCAAKLHVVYEPHAKLPLRAVVTPDNINDIIPARDMPIEPGASYVFDLAYYSYQWWAELDALGCRFVTRLKTNTKLAVNTELPVPAGTNIRYDRIGHLPRRIGSGRPNPFTDPVREIVVSADHGKTLRLVTNDLDAPAQEIAALYKQRWEIELFFKWVKQNLKIRHFLGTSENAVKIQIYVALIAFLVLRAAHNAQKAISRPQAFARLVKLNIMHRRPLQGLKERPPNASDDPRQMIIGLVPC